MIEIKTGPYKGCKVKDTLTGKDYIVMRKAIAGKFEFFEPGAILLASVIDKDDKRLDEEWILDQDFDETLAVVDKINTIGKEKQKGKKPTSRKK